jgi:ribosomal protein S27AE
MLTYQEKYQEKIKQFENGHKCPNCGSSMWLAISGGVGSRQRWNALEKQICLWTCQNQECGKTISEWAIRERGSMKYETVYRGL